MQLALQALALPVTPGTIVCISSIAHRLLRHKPAAASVAARLPRCSRGRLLPLLLHARRQHCARRSQPLLALCRRPCSVGGVAGAQQPRLPPLHLCNQLLHAHAASRLRQRPTMHARMHRRACSPPAPHTCILRAHSACSSLSPAAWLSAHVPPAPPPAAAAPSKQPSSTSLSQELHHS